MLGRRIASAEEKEIELYHPESSDKCFPFDRQIKFDKTPHIYFKKGLVTKMGHKTNWHYKSGGERIWHTGTFRMRHFLKSSIISEIY